MTRKLAELAVHADNGACNPNALIHGLSDAIKGLSQTDVRSSIAVKIVVDQISYIIGESAGPSPETCRRFAEMLRHTHVETNGCVNAAIMSLTGNCVDM